MEGTTTVAHCGHERLPSLAPEESLLVLDRRPLMGTIIMSLLLIGALDDLAVQLRLGLLPERRPRAGGDHPAHPAADGAYLTLALRELQGQNALTPSVNAPSQAGPTPGAAPLLRQTRKGWTKTR